MKRNRFVMWTVWLLAVGLWIACASSTRAATPLLTHLSNGGFEQTAPNASGALQAVGWDRYGLGCTVDAAEHHAGANSIRCHNDAVTAGYGAAHMVTLNQTTPRPVVVSGWSKAEGVDGSADIDYSAYVDLTYTDGTALWGQTAAFDTGTHGWQRRHLLIFPAKPIRSMTVYALFRYHRGTVWFDDFDARELPPTSLFDGQPVSPPALPASARAGWFLRDVAANSLLMPIHAGSMAQGIRLKGLPIVGKVLRAEVRNATGQARALTVYYVERFEPKEAVWWNDLRQQIPASGGEYANLQTVSVGATGHLSLYPFGCVTGRGIGRALGIPPSLGPRVTRIAYHARAHLLYAAFDIALTGRGDPAGHDRAEVAVAPYAVDPQWGFRDATARFYALFPQAFARRAKADGIWMPFTNPSKIANLQDFHIAYHEGDNSVATDRAQGILSFRYVEPMTYWMPMPKAMPRTYDAALALVTQLAASGDETTRRQAQAVLTSGSRDSEGRFNVEFRNAPWCDGAVWVLNPNPRLPHPADQWTKARLNEAGEPAPGAANQPDSEYLDSLEGWADTLDYRPESLRSAKYPLIFTPDDFRPVLPTWFSVYEATEAVSRDLHQRGKLLMANSTPWRFAAFGSRLDVMGTETDMFSNGNWSPEPDARFNLRRTVCYHKPYLLLLNTDFTKLSFAKIELYFQRCLFYGVFPSMFSVNAADHPYWEDPTLYNRDRPLFQKYVPVIQRLSRAGWEPVTGARADVPTVWLERYGKQYLTVLNSADAPQEVRVQIDPAYFGGRRAASWRVQDAVTGEAVPIEPGKNRLMARLRLQGSETRVLALTPVGR